ncbi:MAG: hypothetical protein AABX37_04965 [Nanoarchaeota archaeon]
MTLTMYQQKVVYAALELSAESQGRQGYEFRYVDHDLLITPRFDIPGRGATALQPLRVPYNQEKIVGGDETVVGELELKVRAMKSTSSGIHETI